MATFEEGMEGMVDVYIYESNTLLEQLDDILMATESNNSFGEDDINEIFRIMHTIKGSSAMMGLTNMSTLAHSIEDMFYIIREQKPVIHSIAVLYDLVFTASDLLKAEIEIIQDDDYTPTDFSAQIAKIEDFVTYLKTGEMPAGMADAQSAENNDANKVSDTKTDKPLDDNSDDNGFIVVKVIFEDGCEMENLRALLLINKLKEDCKKISYEPADIENNPDTAKTIIENGFIIKFIPMDSEENVMTIIENALNVKSYEILEEPSVVKNQPEIPVKPKEEVKKQEIKIDDKPVEAPKKAEKPAETTEQPAGKSVEQINDMIAKKKNVGNKGKQSLISVNLNKLDQLLDMVGEIVIAEAMVISNPDIKNLKIDNFQKASRQLRKLTDELQDIVMSIRMVPLSGVFNKMTRIVRDMKVKLNKDVELVFEGEETEVDKSVIDNLNDPLMHMVRNSMDHGIEKTAEERVANGKSPKGTIKLSAYNSSGEVIIVVSDDGGGIDEAKVLEKAKSHNLLTKPAEEYTDKEIFNMVMLPGFSTNDAVTEFSGRGVGMDVVIDNIEKIGGSVSVDSKKGQGTNFIIKIPLSLAIVDGIEVSVGPSIFTLPINSIKEFIKLKEKQIFHDTSGKEMVKIRDKCYPFIRLDEVFGLKSYIDSIYDGVAVLVEEEGKRACILVDELIGEQQVVVKSFSPLLSQYNIKQNGMAGCTILGDGSITIILDVGNIISDY